MVAVLHPRLLKAPGGKAGPLTYPELTRRIYMKTLGAYGTKFADRASALEWLAARP